MSRIILPLRYALEREGWQVSLDQYGDSGTALFSQQGFDFIILDVGLPDINGFEVCKQLRQNIQRDYCSWLRVMMRSTVWSFWKLARMTIAASPLSAREIVARIKAFYFSKQSRLARMESFATWFIQNYTVARGHA